MENIREAHIEDVSRIQALLTQMDYARPIETVYKNLERMLSNNSYKIIVYESEGKVIGLITIHFFYQIAYEGETGTIGFFVVDSNARSKGIGKALEEYCTGLAKKRGCALIEVYSSERRIEAHRFYERQGYKAYQKFFMKELNEKV